MKQLTIDEANKMILPGRTTEEYQKDYYYIIELAKPRGLDKNKIDFYCETHHVIAKCMNGTDESDNLRSLSYLEHIVAHILLYFIYPDNIKITNAAWKMTRAGNNHVDKATFDNIISRLNLKLLLEIKEKAINSYRIPVVCLDDEDNIIAIYKSSQEVYRLTGIASASVTNSRRNGTRGGGYYWVELEDYKSKFPEKVNKFLQLSEEEKPKINPFIKRTNKTRVICYSLFSNKIYKIYSSVVKTRELGKFHKSGIEDAMKLSKRRPLSSGLGISQGWRWCRESNWKFPDEIKIYEDNNPNINPIPFNLSGILLIDINYNILKEYSSARIASKEFPGENLEGKIYATNKEILKLNSGWFIKIRDYVELYEDKWLDYLRHKQENLTKLNNNTDETV